VIQIGVDFGGTKIEAAALNAAGDFVARVRARNPGSYDAAIEAVCALVSEVESIAREPGTVRRRTLQRSRDLFAASRCHSFVYFLRCMGCKSGACALGRLVRGSGGGTVVDVSPMKVLARQF